MVTQTFRGTAQLETPNDPVIQNIVSPATPGDEFNITIPNNTQKLLVKARDRSTLLLSYEINLPTYVTIVPGTCYTEDGVNLVGAKFYLKCSGVSSVIEVITWS